MTLAFADDVRLCLNCMRWHENAPCSHDPGRICACGKPVGYRATDDDGAALGSSLRCTPCNWLTEP